MYGNLGFPALGLPGSGIATTASVLLMFAGMAAVVTFERRFRRYRLFGRFWRADWPRLKAFLRLGMPIAALLLFEVSIFNAASFLMGLINAASIAAYAIAIQVASLSFMVPLGLGQAVTVRVGRAHGAGDYEAVTRAGWTAYVMGVGFMAVMAAVMVFLPYPLISAFIDIDAPGNAHVVGLAATFLAFAGLFQIVDGAQAVARRHAARPARHDDPDDLCAVRLLGRRPAARRGARLSGRARGTRHLDRPFGGARGRGRAAARPLAATGPAGVDRAARPVTLTSLPYGLTAPPALSSLGMRYPDWSETMGMLPSHIGAMVLASAIACAGLTPASAAPTFLPDTPKLRSDVVLAQNSVIIRRENSHHDGGGRNAGTIAATTATLPGTIMTAPGSSARELPRNTPTTHTGIIAGTAGMAGTRTGGTTGTETVA